MSRITIVTDAEPPQINGVVKTLWKTRSVLEEMGHQVDMITTDPEAFKCRVPSYREIQIQPFTYNYVARRIKSFNPHYIHIATEGSLGLAARSLCLEKSRPFSTAFHTDYANYVHLRVQRGLHQAGFPQTISYNLSQKALAMTWKYLRWFHAPSSAVMVASPALRAELARKGFRRIVNWSRGVDTKQFHPYGKDVPAYAALKRPILVYMGRVSMEKNIESFLELPVQGSKVVIGSGPALSCLQSQFPNALYLGAKHGEDLARHVAAADMFVFPSKTDTFGLVVLEALACGVPVVAFPVPGPLDVLGHESCTNFSCLDQNLENGVKSMFKHVHDKTTCMESARRYVTEHYAWETCTEQFFQNLQADTPHGRRITQRLARVTSALRPWRLLYTDRKVRDASL